LEEVEIAPIDQGDIDIGATELLGGVEAAEPSSNNDHARPLHAQPRQKKNGKMPAKPASILPF
jgi:hypothetical protein